MKVSCDVQVSRKAIEVAQAAGHTVVYWARTEPDELWINRSMALGAELFISADSDIAWLAHKHNKGFIRIPPGVGKDSLVSFIMNNINLAQDFYNTHGFYPKSK